MDFLFNTFLSFLKMSGNECYLLLPCMLFMTEYLLFTSVEVINILVRLKYYKNINVKKLFNYYFK